MTEALNRAPTGDSARGPRVDETPGPHPLTRRRPESSTSAHATPQVGSFRFPRFSKSADILALAVPAMSREQAERWATRGAADRVARAMREHDVWVAVEGAAIGWVEVDRDRVAALYVSPSCSRRGGGSVLLTFAETSIRSSGYTTARLESSQNALDYYLRRGYLRCGPAASDGAWPLRKDLAAVTPNQGMEPTR